MICKFCGKEIEEGSPICNHCAKPVPSVYSDCANQEEVTLKEKELEQQNKLEESNKKSIQYAKISLWLNGIAIIPAIFCCFCYYNYVMQDYHNIFGNDAKKYAILNNTVYIPQNVYTIASYIKIPLGIIILCGIVFGILPNIQKNKNKIAKVAFAIIILIVIAFIIYVGFMTIMHFYFIGEMVRDFVEKVIDLFMSIKDCRVKLYLAM